MKSLTGWERSFFKLLVVLVAGISSGCFHTIDARPVPPDIEESRWLSRPKYAAFGSRWSAVDGEIVGVLQWQHCVIDRRWTTGTKRTLRSKPNPELGGALHAPARAVSVERAIPAVTRSS